MDRFHKAFGPLVVASATLALGVSLAPGAGLPAPPQARDYYPRDPAREQLGRLLFFDKILSGNRDISCATCHNPLLATADGLSLSVGQGGVGLGPARETGTARGRVPRNSPALFNLGAREFTRMFHDGRVEVDPSYYSGFRSPAGAFLPAGLDSVLAAQAMFPVASAHEMAGHADQNRIGRAAAKEALGGRKGIWNLIAARLRANPEYVDLFTRVFEDVDKAGDMTYLHAANAIGAYVAAVGRSDDSPFDRYLRGDRLAMAPGAVRGMELFYGEAGCASCHSGPFQTDHEFHALGVPQIGPGKGDDLPGYTDALNDFGRERVTADPADRFRFRTPSLRNVALTGPWGHDGAFADLESVVRHHLDPLASLLNYDMAQAVLPPDRYRDAVDFLCHEDPVRRGVLAAAAEIEPFELTGNQMRDLLEFLGALTDPRATEMTAEVPSRVPSGLPVAD